MRANVRKIGLVFLSWCVLGACVGIAGGYFTYVKKTPMFRSTALVLVNRPSTVEMVAAANETRSLPSGVAVDSTAFESGDVGSETEIQTVESPGSPRREEESSSTDDSFIMQSEGVVASAIQSGGLHRLQDVASSKGVRQPSPEALAKVLIASGNIQVTPVASSPEGQVYRISFRGTLPSSSERVLASLVSAIKQHLTSPGGLEDHKKFAELITVQLQELESRAGELKTELTDLQVPSDAWLKDGVVISPAAEQYDLLRVEVGTLKAESIAIDGKLRRAQTLIAEGASASSIMESLDQRISLVMPTNDTVGANDAFGADKDAEHRAWLEMRAKMIATVDAEVAPLQRELDSLLVKLGGKHPTVVHLRSQIAKARSKLASLPPEPSPSGQSPRNTPTRNQTATTRGVDALSEETPGEQVTKLLRAFRKRASEIEVEIRTLQGELVQQATLVSRQESILKDEARVEAELAQTIDLRAVVADELKELRQAPERQPCEVTVLRQPTLGEKVEPVLSLHLATGAILGILTGAVLSGLFLISQSVPPQEQN